MFSIIFGSVFIIIALIATWAYIPLPVRQKTAAFIASATGTDPQNSALVEEIFISSSPEKKREVLLGQLKKEIGEIKKTVTEEKTSVTNKVAAEPNNQPALGENSPDPIAAVEEIIKKLEEVNDDEGIKEKITEKVLETILPPPKPLECKAEDKS